MKTKILLMALLGGLFATANLIAQNDPDTNAVPPPATVPPDADETPGDETPQPPAMPDDSTPPAASAPAVSPAAPSTPVPAAAPAPILPVVADKNAPPGSRGLTFNFHGARLEDVLKYMSDAAGFVILPKVDVNGKVDVLSAQPLSKDEAVALLQKILTDKGYSVLRDGRTLTIINSRDAKNRALVMSQNDPDKIPNNDDVATDIVAVHSLNAVQLVKDLESLKPGGLTISANDSANSLVLTGTQGDIRHFTEIIKALDSVNNSSATVRVYHLRYADSKATASLIKDLFPSPDANNRNGAGGFGRLRGGGFGGGFGAMFGGGGPGGGGGGSDNPADTGHTPTAKVSAVSDDHSNSLIVSAPDSLIQDIDALVKDLDNPVDDTTEIQVFHLLHADAGETADLLTALFPDDTGSSDATRQQIRFGPFGGFGGQQQNNSSSPSDRAKKASRVVAVPDKRTSSVVVTAGKDLMPQIIGMIKQLDERTDRVYSPHVIPLANTEPIQMQQILQNLFPAANTTGSSSGSSSTTINQQDYMNQRMQTLLQQMNSSQNSGFSGGFGSSSGTGRTGN